MNCQRWAERLYILNFALLLSHQIDSAYWREWEMFHMPGGVQLFVALNFLLAVVALIGFRQLMLGTRTGHILALALALAGIVAFGLHTYFWVALRRPEFRLPVSVAVLALTLLASVAQALFTFRSLTRKQPGRTGTERM